ncbi:MAG: hypothetical protein AAFN16_24355 [Pseudomonadota bacterium]
MKSPAFPDPERLERLPRRKKRIGFEKAALPTLTVVSTGLAGLAFPGLIEADSTIDFVKSGVFAAGAGVVSYAVNSFAIEKGTRLAAIGSTSALLTSVSSIVTVGVGLAGATYAGLVFESTDRLLLEDYGREQAAYISMEVEAAQEHARYRLVLENIRSNLNAKATCEREASCISRNGNGGEGSVYFTLQSDKQKAEAVLSQVASVETQTKSAIDKLLNILGQYDRVVADGNLSRKERRLRAQALVSAAAPLIGELQQADPEALVAGYAQSLTSGVSLPGNPEAEEKLNRLRSSQVSELRSSLGSGTTANSEPPSFPGKAGVTDTIKWIGHFLPIAMIVAVIELVFPITYWLYTFLGLRARLIQEETSEDQPQPRASALRRHGRT